MPKFVEVTKDVLRSIDFKATKECEFLFKIMTGYYLIEKVE